ncbi:PqqD family peptide modification chaperone [Streptomyces sp. NPDC093018]|uniref:radical SAM protein n=1 Tax=Streptomyces sp. NPDC093018 TaxID=3155067 RepID=UPI0034418EF0
MDGSFSETPVPDAAEIASRYRYREDLNLLFNSRTGQYHLLGNRTAQEIFHLAATGSAVEEIVDILSKRYSVAESIVRSDAVEFFGALALDRLESTDTRIHTGGIDKGRGMVLDFPLRMEIELTSLCNWNCGFCYNVWKIDPNLSDRDVRRKIRELPTKHLPFDRVKQILDECAAKGCYIVRYSGGETLLHPDALEIFEYGGRLGLYQVLFTNGHFIDEAVAERLARSNVRCALVSLHGDRETQNSLAGHKLAYDRATNAMRLLLHAGIDVVAEMTLVKENVSGVLGVMKDVHSIGVRNVGVMRYVPTGKDDDKFGVPVTVNLPLMREIDELVRTECPDLTVSWPCGQKLCTSDDDLPLSAEDPTLALRFSQLSGHCESGIIWGSVSFDGKLRNCPHSNVYFGETEDGLSQGWARMTKAVTEAVAPRSTCAGCAVIDACKGGCHLPKFMSPESDGMALPLLQLTRKP